MWDYTGFANVVVVLAFIILIVLPGLYLFHPLYFFFSVFFLHCIFLMLQVIQHGACLGLGLAALGTADEDIYDDIKTVLYTDSAVAGEAAGIGMGLLMVGTASEKAGEMLAYAHETQHEKIIR